VKRIVGVLVVLFLVGMAVPTARTRIFDAMSPVTNRIKTAGAGKELETMADQLEIRVRTKGPLAGGDGPWTGWLRSGYSGDPEDPWGNLYYLKMSRRSAFTVGSKGPDGERGTEDDITVTR
jgi:type II secretion system (T2SS) protein G